LSCGFTRELTPLGGVRSQAAYAALLAGLVAHGTNLGIATMAQSTDGISPDPARHEAPPLQPRDRCAGGRSRGKGSGSPLRLYHCGCEPPVKVRVASDELRAHCDLCGKPFERPAPTAGSSAGAPA
jgi:hypothetical protein